MNNGMTFEEMAKDLEETINEIEARYESEKQKAIEHAGLNFIAGICGRATASGDVTFKEQAYRLMPYLKREG